MNENMNLREATQNLADKSTALLRSTESDNGKILWQKFADAWQNFSDALNVLLVVLERERVQAEQFDKEVTFTGGPDAR